MIMSKTLVADATAGKDPHTYMDGIPFDELYAGMVDYCEGTQFDGPLPENPEDPDPIPEDNGVGVDQPDKVKKVQGTSIQV